MEYGPRGLQKVRIKNVEKGQVWTQVNHQPLGDPEEQFKKKALIALAGVAAEHFLLGIEPVLSESDRDYKIMVDAAEECGQEVGAPDEWFSKSEQLLEPHEDKLDALFEYLKVHDSLGPDKLLQLVESR